MKFKDYPIVTGFDSGDVLLKDGTNGTKTILYSDAAAAFFKSNMTADMHRNFYRGKNLGSSVTTAQKAATQNGTFDDLFVGDYWSIGGTVWRIADIDYWYNCGDTAFTRHHLVIVPDSSLGNARMNETNITTGAYVNSEMYTTNLETAKTKVQSAFGELVLTHREYLQNATTNGYASAGAWFDSTVELMNEPMVYGSYIHAPAGNGSIIPSRYTCSKQQLALFALNPKKVNIRATYWLRDVVSSAYFAYVNTNGDANYYGASNSHGVRPVFAIG